MARKTKKKAPARPHRDSAKGMLEVAATRRAEMVSLLRRGWTYSMIAEKYDISAATAAKTCVLALQELRDIREEDARLVLEQKLEELAEVKRTAWEAYAKSCQGRTEVKEKKGLVWQDTAHIDTTTGKASVVKRPVMKTIEKVTTTSDPEPSAKMLNVVLECIRQERELLGLDRPRQVEVRNTFTWDSIVKGIKDGLDEQGRVPDSIEERLRKLREQGPNDPDVIAARGNLQERIVLDHREGIIPRLPDSIPGDR
jgi:hypothetical protein